MTSPLEDFAMIGDGETVALISRAASIDWWCLPRFDSPACCAAILGSEEHGRWSIAPVAKSAKSSRRYLGDSMIVETDFTTRSGAIRITDFMPIRDGNPSLVRMVTGISGHVATLFDLSLRFDYGVMPAWVSKSDAGVVLHVGPDMVVLRGPGAFEVENGTVRQRFDVKAGSTHSFVLTYGASHEPLPKPINVEKALAGTKSYWSNWIGQFDKPVEHADAVRRSLLTLKALIHRPTGGLVAAPTTSLPEQAGGAMNWDYRYCWLRDATFTLNALVDCGYLEEARAWRDWILRAVAGEPDDMQIMYRVDGSRRLDETEIPLPGYRFARPVRVGNAAAGQLQLDVYGELIRTLDAAEKAGLEDSEQSRHVQNVIVHHVEAIWTQPDQGLWESRGEARHYTYSKVMAWVALQRFLDGNTGRMLSSTERKRMQILRDHIHQVICTEAFDPGLGSFTAYFGGQGVDASLLLLPKVQFLPATDERMVGTISHIEKTLMVDGLVRRHLMDVAVPEGAFLACSFWLAECQLGQGRRADALASIERALAVGSELGLLSEEYDTVSQRLTGNFPQALSHLALIHALITLAKFDQTGGTN